MKPNSVLARLAASWGISETAVPQAADVAALQVEFDAFRLQSEADMKEVSAALEAAVALSKEVEAERDVLAAKLAAVEAAATVSAAQAAAAKVKARSDKLTSLLGTDRAATVMEATAQMSDEGFEAVVAAMAVTSANEAKSPMFTETGANAEVDASAVADESLEMQTLRKKYSA